MFQCKVKFKGITHRQCGVFLVKLILSIAHTHKHHVDNVCIYIEPFDYLRTGSQTQTIGWMGQTAWILSKYKFIILNFHLVHSTWPDKPSSCIWIFCYCVAGCAHELSTRRRVYSFENMRWQRMKKKIEKKIVRNHSIREPVRIRTEIIFRTFLEAKYSYAIWSIGICTYDSLENVCRYTHHIQSSMLIRWHISVAVRKSIFNLFDAHTRAHTSYSSADMLMQSQKHLFQYNRQRIVCQRPFNWIFFFCQFQYDFLIKQKSIFEELNVCPHAIR